MMLKGFKIFQWLYSENPYIRMNLLFPYPPQAKIVGSSHFQHGKM